ncbi:hypothetical protein DFH27DRAFT_653756 [Peziza echinospora]|nr:hypothetical protein DFH27DRAFT_653756 [Peziza echinospora]
MADDKKNIYGTPGDTTFRKKYDREEYAQRARDRESGSRDRKPALSSSSGTPIDSKDDHKPLHLHKHRHVTPPGEGGKHTTSRATRLDLSTQLNKTVLVPAGASTGKRGRGAGFYCDACDLTFKDSLQWVDHLNSKQHLYATGETGEVVRASLEMVRERLEVLRARRRREMEGGGEVDLKGRLEERRRVEEEERRVKREGRREKRRGAKERGKVKGEGGASGGGGLYAEEGGVVEEEEEDADALAMARMMGFSGAFGSTKKV